MTAKVRIDASSVELHDDSLGAAELLKLAEDHWDRRTTERPPAGFTAGALGGSTERPVYNPRPARLSRGQQPNVVGEAS